MEASVLSRQSQSLSITRRRVIFAILIKCAILAISVHLSLYANRILLLSL